MRSILLDTNVLSELMRTKPATDVLDWFERQKDASFFICAITRAEILLGIALLPAGKRRDNLATTAEQMFAEDFAGRSLPFDNGCATEYAVLVAARTRQGRSISTEDAQIAAVALVNGMALATRNGKDFKGIEGLTVISPWA
ncbi:MAG: type II toxin-antitoxin system VapC family toxin [Sulfuricella sp.]|nr:type II toxin-antitoxin system VapC family toxin [Sulfuricella sp.]